MTTYYLLIAAFMVAASLAAIPAAIILKKLGLSIYWAVLLFLILVTTPFLPDFVRSFIPSSVIVSMPLPLLGGLLKLVEWAPGLIFLWVLALRPAPKDASRP